jgi:HSP20 family protein
MSTPARRESRALVPDLLDLLEMPFPALRSSAGQAIRVEEYVHDGEYVIRAELPGIDPDKDLEISVTRGMLTIRAERHEEHEGRHRSEFRYGTYERHVALPENTKEEEIKATYDKGILAVTVPLHEAKESARRIAVEKKS